MRSPAFIVTSDGSGPACLRHAPSQDPLRGRVVAIPHAGGSASAYRNWAPQLPAGVETVVVQPPGRETRSDEPATPDMSVRVAEVAAAIAALDPLPTVVFGHSLGAYVALEVCRELAATGGSPVVHLVVAGAAAPHRPRKSDRLAHLGDDQFLSALFEFGGVPEELRRYQQFLVAVLPMIRADVEMAELYLATEEPRLSCPITAFAGTDDSLVPPSTMDAWCELTTSTFDSTILPGDHFFVASQQERILTRLGRLLAAGQSSEVEPSAHA